MSQQTHLSGITSHTIPTARGHFHVLEAGEKTGLPVVFIHGNSSSSTFWEETMLALPAGYRAIAPDMRGYGESEVQPVDATRGMRDFSDDIHSLVKTLGLTQFHLIGHSLGGCIVMQYTIDHTQYVRTLTLNASGSPYGFGGTKDTTGTPCWPDYAGSGGGLIHPELHQRIATGDRSEESMFSPRFLIKNRFIKPSSTLEREDALLEALLCMATGEGNYSRDMTTSTNWPYIAPGMHGVNNALSPKYCNMGSLGHIDPKLPICWIYGTHDQVVSDASLGDAGTLGAMGVIPQWPGAEVYPSQPMVSQIRTILQQYQANGGVYSEHVIDDVGHMPHLENLSAFLDVWIPFLQAH